RRAVSKTAVTEVFLCHTSVILARITAFAKLTLVTLAERLAESLRKLRNEMGLSQRGMAGKLGVSQATLARLESGVQNIKLEVLERICRSLRCDVGELFGGRLRPPSRRR